MSNGSPIAIERFVRGDAVELAIWLLRALEQRTEAEVIFDAGAFHRYDPLTGLWNPIDEHTVSCEVQLFAGVPSGIKNQPLKLSASAIDGVIKCARSQAADPAFFAKPAAGLGFTNGFLSVTAAGVALGRHSPENRAMVGLPFAYDANAPRLRWERFLAEVFSGDVDSSEKVLLLQEFVGASLCGIAIRYAKALVLLGTGRNGKGVFLHVVSRLFPRTAVAAIPPQEWENEYRRAAFHGVRFNAVNELPAADVMRGEIVKAVIAGDPISARPIYGAPTTVLPVAGHVFAANQLPGSNDVTRAFWERFAIVDFNRFFTESERDTSLEQQLIDEELPGVAAWAVEGAARLLGRGPRGGYTQPSSHQRLLAEWTLAADQVARFVLDNTKPAVGPSRVTGKALYSHYRNWAMSNGHAPLSNTKFAQRVRALGHTSVKPENATLYPFELLRGAAAAS